MAVDVSIVITTRNRKNDLRRAIISALRQDVPCEVIVMDDSSIDGTAEMVKIEFPSVRLEHCTPARGYIVNRNRAAALAHGRFIFSIDDDAEFSTSRIVEQTLRDFDHPKVGAVFIPHKDIRRTVFEKTPTPPYPDRWVVPSFVGTAHALLRDVFIKLGGYREILEHNTEERDFCLRLLDNGFAVRLGTAEPIHHYPSPIRDAWRGRMLERRNDICFGIMDVPFPHVLCHLPGTICSGLMFGFRNGCLQQTLAGYVNALRTSRRAWRERRPVRGDTYMMIRRLNRHSLLPWSDLEPLLERNAARQRKASSGLSSETRPVES